MTVSRFGFFHQLDDPLPLNAVAAVRSPDQVMRVFIGLLLPLETLIAVNPRVMLCCLAVETIGVFETGMALHCSGKALSDPTCS